MSRILVTGGAGFIGAHLCRTLFERGHAVISLDNHMMGTAPPIAGVDYREGHTKDIAKLVPEKPDLIYHLGEYSRVEKSLDEPRVVWDLNVHGTFEVLEYWRWHNRGADPCKLIYAGSSTKFADGGLGRDQSPYAWTKATNTELVRNYATWYDLPFAITYFYNVYGPGERAGSYGTVVEIFRQRYLKRAPLVVSLPGTQRRNFTHVEDIVEGLMLVGEKGDGDEFGLGATESYTILELAHMFGDEVLMESEERPGNRMSATLDTSKSRAIGWRPTRVLKDYIDLVKKDRKAA